MSFLFMHIHLGILVRWSMQVSFVIHYDYNDWEVQMRRKGRIRLLIITFILYTTGLTAHG